MNTFIIIGIIIALLGIAGYGILIYRKNRAERRASPGTPPVVVAPAKPVVPVVEQPLPNPFIGYRARGLSLFDIQMNVLHRGLTALEKEQARDAGYVVDPVLSEGGGVDRSSPNLKPGGYVHEKFLRAGQAHTVHFTVDAAHPFTDVTVFSSRGSRFYALTDDKGVHATFSRFKPFYGELEPGDYSYSFSVDVDGWVSVQQK